MKLNRYAAGAAVAMTLAAPSLAQAQTSQDLTSLRRDMETLRKDYEAKVGDLETRLAKAEADAASARAAAEQAQSTAQASAGQAGVDQIAAAPEQVSAPLAPASNNAFNPGMAAVLNGFAVAASDEPGAGGVAGFATGDEIAGPPRGFSLGESEVSLFANIDPSLSGFVVFAFDGDNEVSVEESYLRTTNLPDGLTLTAGRFFSGIGYNNENHSHNWSFSDAALPYKAFLNGQFGDDGVQLRWLAPTDQYLEFGAEAFRGDSFPAGGAANDGIGAYSLFARTGSDIDDSSNYLASLSYLHTRSIDRGTGADLFTGDNDLGILSLVYKWAPNGNPTVQNLALTSEIFFGKQDGAFNSLPVSQSNTGWYAQGVYQFMPSWKAGLRLAGLNSQDPGALLAGSALDDLGHSPFEASALLEFDTSEFGRLRLQYTRDEAGQQSNDALTLQYTVIYGAHGAHRY